MSVRIGFQRPGTNRVSRLIADHDAPRSFSHVAIFPAPDRRCDAHIDYGVRFHDFTPDVAAWVMVEFPATPDEVETVRRFLEDETGCGYDRCGVLAIAGVPLMHADPEKWFCSELTCAALQTIGHLSDLIPHQTTPNSLYLAAKDVGTVL